VLGAKWVILPVPEERVVDQPLTGVLHDAGSTRFGARVMKVVGEPGTRRRRWTLIAAAMVGILLSGGVATGLTLRH
jgi:hypothetical protein